MRNFSQAAANNSAPILAELQRLLREPVTVLEIGSGTGQHAIHFAAHMPWLTWQPTEQDSRLDDLTSNINELALERVRTPMPLDLSRNDWPAVPADHVYAANVIHIVSQHLGEALIAGAGERLGKNGLLLLYGPFCYEGNFTSESNAAFNDWLKARDISSGIRDFEWVSDIAELAGFDLQEDCTMPANNRLLVFRHK